MGVKEERETCVLFNDAGEVTVWSCSPGQIKKLTRRLGKPDWIKGRTAFWASETARFAPLLPRKRRKGGPGRVGGFKPQKPPSNQPLSEPDHGGHKPDCGGNNECKCGLGKN